MLSRLLLSLTITAFVVGFAWAEDKKKPEPKDKPALKIWERESSGVTVKIMFDKETLRAMVIQGENGFKAACKFTTDKDGTVKATVIEAAEKGMFPLTPKKGYEFSFKWSEKDDTATLSDLKGEGLADAKAVVEGEYKKAK
jgi:hypothetical protein